MAKPNHTGKAKPPIFKKRVNKARTEFLGKSRDAIPEVKRVMEWMMTTGNKPAPNHRVFTMMRDAKRAEDKLKFERGVRKSVMYANPLNWKKLSRAKKIYPFMKLGNTRHDLIKLMVENSHALQHNLDLLKKNKINPYFDLKSESEIKERMNTVNNNLRLLGFKGNVKYNGESGLSDKDLERITKKGKKELSDKQMLELMESEMFNVLGVGRGWTAFTAKNHELRPDEVEQLRYYYSKKLREKKSK